MKPKQAENQKQSQARSKIAGTRDIDQKKVLLAIESVMDMNYATSANKILIRETAPCPQEALAEHESEYYYKTDASISVNTFVKINEEYTECTPPPKLTNPPSMGKDVLKSSVYKGQVRQRRGRFLLWPVNEGEKLDLISS